MKLEPILFVPDTHAPYHEARAWNLMLKVGRALKPTHLVHIGDFMDCYSISDHDKSPARAGRFLWEVEECNRMLDQLDALKPAKKYYIEGNHEDRLRRYVMKHPELNGVVTVPELLRLKQRGWAYTPYKRTAKLGKAHLTHDVGSAGRNAIFKALDTYQHTVITGHTHRMQYVVEGNAVGECKLSAAFGWLGDVEQIDYMHLHRAKKDWALGFGIGYLNPKNGYVYTVPVPIIDHTCVVNGVLYRG
jgi:predicted phosphodiesterase